MKCMNCNKCYQRGGYQYFFCGHDNTPISSDEYYKGKEMDCIETQIENKEFLEDYICWTIARK